MTPEEAMQQIAFNEQQAFSDAINKVLQYDPLAAQYLPFMSPEDRQAVLEKTNKVACDMGLQMVNAKNHARTVWDKVCESGEINEHIQRAAQNEQRWLSTLPADQQRQYLMSEHERERLRVKKENSQSSTDEPPIYYGGKR